MKYAMLAAALAMGVAITAHAENGRSSNSAVRSVYSGAVAEAANKISSETGSVPTSLAALFAEWDWAGFAPPSKPSQALVYGRHGYVISGAGYHALVSLIRSATIAVREDRDQDAAARIAKARTLLATSKPRRE